MQVKGDAVVEYGRRRWAIVAAVMAASLLVTVDVTIVNVALPTIAGNIGANFDEGAWIITAYIVAAIIVIPLTPWLQQTFGRKEYFVAATAGFTAASLLCGISSSLPELVAFRILQGLCGGGLLSTGQAVLRDTFPPEDLGKSQALAAIGAVGGPAIAPLLGGILTDALSWNWVFYINIVPGVLASIVLVMLLRNPPYQRKPSGFDLPGLVLLIVGLGSLQYVLDEGERYDWFADAHILGLAVIAGVGLGAFACWEIFGARNPIVDLRILRNRTVAAGAALGMTIGGALIGGIVLAPQFTQGVLNWTATLSGEAIMVRAMTMLAFTPVVLLLLNRFRVPPPVVIGSGFIAVAAANAMQAFVTTTDSSFWTFGPALALGGAGFIMQYLPLSVAVLSSVQGADTQKALSLMSLSNQLGGSIATAALVTLLDRRSALHAANIAGDVTRHSPAVAAALQQHVPLSAINRLIEQQATTAAFADAFFGLAAVTGALTVLVVLLRAPRAAS
jgi:DHA2 family multidrug resistance protein